MDAANASDRAGGPLEPPAGHSIDPRALEAVFAELFELPAEAREPRLAELAASSPGLAAELRSLLLHSDRISRFMPGPLRPSQVPELQPATAFTPPESVGGFRLLRELGRGASGIVWLAEQERPRRQVALKLLRWDHPGPEAIRRFLQEAELLGRLDHPACARVIEAGLLERPGAPTVPWIAMAYVDGQPLAAALAGRSWEATLELFEALAAGVHAAHQAGIVHRDLKPDNVLVDAAGQPVVLDFGVARLLEDPAGSDPLSRTQTGWLIGTPAYMAPEQARGERAHIDARTDVFALAAMLYEALTGELPIDTRGATITEALQRIAERDPLPLRERAPHLPRDLERVLAQGLAREPERRYPSARAFAADLAAVRTHRPVAARPPSLAYQALRFVQRHRTLTAAVATALLSLGAGLLAALLALDRARTAEQSARAEQVATRRLADLHMIGELERIERELWPATPDTEPALARWVAEARALAARLAPDLARLAEDRAAFPPEEHNPLVRAAAFLGSTDPLRGLLGLQTRLDRARRVRRETVEQHAAAWDAAAARVAEDPRFNPDPAHPTFLLAPQLGLVPLGPDPVSKLEEFAEWPWTGEIPIRDPTTGLIQLSASTALVVVLVPGGLVSIGHQRDDQALPRFESHAQPHEPVHPVDLSPYLIGKYEFTLHHWKGLGLAVTTYWKAGYHVNGIDVDDGFPVDTVAHEGARRAAQRLGFDLPTEAQFEVAAWAGRDSSWWRPPTLRSLAQWSRSELFDRLLAEGASPDEYPLDPDVPLPAGSLAPNPYGLHEMYGGFNELCLDTFWVDAGKDPRPGGGAPILRRPGDGLAVHPDPDEEATNPHRVMRHCPDWWKAPEITLAGRSDRVAGSAETRLGFRVARTLSPTSAVGDAPSSGR